VAWFSLTKLHVSWSRPGKKWYFVRVVKWCPCSLKRQRLITIDYKMNFMILALAGLGNPPFFKNENGLISIPVCAMFRARPKVASLLCNGC
jgi:hypothetical protein